MAAPRLPNTFLVLSTFRGRPGISLGADYKKQPAFESQAFGLFGNTIPSKTSQFPVYLRLVSAMLRVTPPCPDLACWSREVDLLFPDSSCSWLISLIQEHLPCCPLNRLGQGTAPHSDHGPRAGPPVLLGTPSGTSLSSSTRTVSPQTSGRLFRVSSQRWESAPPPPPTHTLCLSHQSWIFRGHRGVVCLLRGSTFRARFPQHRGRQLSSSQHLRPGPRRPDLGGSATAGAPDPSACPSLYQSGCYSCLPLRQRRPQRAA